MRERVISFFISHLNPDLLNEVNFDTAIERFAETKSRKKVFKSKIPTTI